MRLPPHRIREFSFWHYQIAGWSLVAVLQISLAVASKGWYRQGLTAVVLQVVAGLLLTSLLRYFYRRIPYQSLSFLSLMSLIAACSVGVTVGWFGLYLLIEHAFGPVAVADLISRPVAVLTVLAYAFPVKLAWSALYFGIKFWRDWVAERDNTARSTEEAQQAQMQMLRYQLNPDFLFDSLGEIQDIIDKDASAARQMITELAEFLRFSLVDRNARAIPLGEELRMIRTYLSLEQRRHEGALAVTYEISDAARGVSVPAFLIYPLVDDAMRRRVHGGTNPLRLAIRVGLTDSMLNVTVALAGERMAPEERVREEGQWTGVDQVRVCLRGLFPDRHRLTLAGGDGEASWQLELALKKGELHGDALAGDPR